MDANEFDATFWLSISTLVAGFMIAILKAMLKSNCTTVTLGCFSCNRPANDSIDVTDIELGRPNFRAPASP